MAESLNMKQVATVLNGIVQQATGKSAIAAITAGDFTSVATTALLDGYDPVLGAISQVVGKTIISSRPYSGRFSELVADSERWGYITRKIVPGLLTAESNGEYSLTDGQHSPDMFDVRKRPVKQFNFYGADTFAYHETYFENQLDSAFHSLEEFRSFVAGMRQAFENDRNFMLETLARDTLTSFVAGVLSTNNATQVLHLITEYNGVTGGSYTPVTIFDPANFPGFIKWAAGFIQTVSEAMESRAVIRHQSVTGFDVYRHTPVNMQRFYMPAAYKNQIGTQVMPGLFHERWLEKIDYRAVDYWQSAQSPLTINVTPTILQANGTTAAAGSAVNTSDVFAVIIDRDAVGVTLRNESMRTAPFEVAGGYSNVWYKGTRQHWMDYTENAVVFKLD